MPAIMEPFPAPDYQDGEWINSPPLSLERLNGRITLLWFWDYVSVNCLHNLSYLQEWWRRYRDSGLVIVGIHTPEYTFERDSGNVRQALDRLDIDFPVMMDNDYHNWDVWANRFWPTIYIVDPMGRVSYFHFGEGDYLGIEWHLQILLTQLHPGVKYPPPMRPLRAMDEPGASCLRATPPLDLGYLRGLLSNQEEMTPNTIVLYTPPGDVALDAVALAGRWRNDPQAVTLDGGEGSILVHYQGKEVYLVMQPPPEGSGLVSLEQDGTSLPEAALGADAVWQENRAMVSVDVPRLYFLVNNPAHGEYRLRITAHTQGLSAYTLSFVSACRVDLEDEAA